MLERWIVKHWIALSAGCLLMAAAVRMAYAQRGYAAIGGEWAIIPIVFLIEWFIKGILILNTSNMQKHSWGMQHHLWIT